MKVRISWVILFVSVINGITGFRCDRRPYASTTQSQASDGRFKLIVDGSEVTYIPDQLYIVEIVATDDESRFSGFMISAEGDVKPDPKNPRRMLPLYPGELRPLTSLTAKFSDRCPYSVEHTMSSPKSSVEVYWQAPQSGNGCITLRAMVVENEDVWFEDGAPLTQILCEDMRQPDDVTPLLNYNCQICVEAKYELSFTGIWSRNTHPRLYPENDWLPRYSDLVGASHAADFILWAPGSLASDGFREFAELANSSKLEGEMKEKIGDGIRTLIKGKGHGFPKMSNPTYAFFRTDKTNHLFTVAIAIYPSPDWFLGVTRFDLCQEDNTWLKERELNLFPWDAGTDSGVSYESPNLETVPQDAVAKVQTSTYDKNSPFYEMDMKSLHPFGRLHVKLIRIYHRDCEEGKDETTEEELSTSTEQTTTEGGEEPSEPDEPSSEAPIVTDPDSSQDCPVSQWQEWSPCDGICNSGSIHGYKWRERYHLVDGIAVEKYDPDADSSTRKEVPQICKDIYDDFEREECEAICLTPEDKKEQDVLTSERRMMQPIAPGHAWNTKRHITRRRYYLHRTL